METQRQVPANDGTMEIDLLEIARLLFSKLLWLILAGILGGAAVYFAVSLLVAPTYRTHVSFYVYNTADSNARNGDVTTSDLNTARSLATTYAQIMSSNSVLDAVIDDLGEGYNLSRSALSSQTSTSVVKDTQLLQVDILTKDPQLSYEIGKSYAKVVPTEIVRITKAGSVEVVDQPEIARGKAGPNLFRYTMIGVLGGVLLAAAIFIIMMLADTTIYLPEDIERVTDAPILGQIPNINDNEIPEGWRKTKGGVIRYGKKDEE